MKKNDGPKRSARERKPDAEKSAVVEERLQEKRSAEEHGALQVLDRIMILVGISSRILNETTMYGALKCAVEGALILTDARVATSGHGFGEGKITVGASAQDADAPPCPDDVSFTINRGGVYLELIHNSPTIRLNTQELVQHPDWWGLPEGHTPLKGLLGARLQGIDGKANGMLLVSRKRHGEFSAEDEALLSQLCLITSLAIRHIEARKTEEERADELDRLRNRLEIILQSAPSLVYLADAEGTLLHVNRRVEELLRRNLNEIEGKRIRDLLPEEFAAPIDANNQHVIRHCVTEEFEEIFPYEYGVRYYSSVKSPLLDPSGQCEAVVCISTDITGKKAYEQTLRESEERFREVFAHAPIGMVVMNTEGQFLHVNDAYCRIMGYEVEEACDPSFTLERITHPDDRERNREELERLVRGDIPSFFMEKRNIRKDGSIIWVRISVSVRRDGSGKPMQVIALIENIDDRKKAEEALQVSEMNYRTIFDSASDAIFIQSADDGRIIDLNRKGLELYKYSHDEVVDRHVETLSAGTGGFTQRKATEIFARAVAGEPQLFEWLAKAKDGALFWVEVSLKKVILQGKDHLLAIVRDISERKKTEARLSRAMDELARSNSDLEEFAYVVSHDLKEPLRMVTGFLQLLERKYKGKLDAKADTYIGFAVDGAKRMDRLIEGLLSYSRIARDGELQLVDLNEVAAAAVANLSASIRESSAEVTCEPLPTLPGDDVQLLQLLQNLISNALKYRKEGVPPRVRVSARHQGTTWLFSVRDNGIGIDPADSKRIFLIFQRLHTPQEYEGTGIGLASCKKIVERHHGKIWVESVPEEGSTFYFTLPVTSNDL